MKYYNVENYVRYKLDLEQTLKNMRHEIVYDMYYNNEISVDIAIRLLDRLELKRKY